MTIVCVCIAPVLSHELITVVSSVISKLNSWQTVFFGSDRDSTYI